MRKPGFLPKPELVQYFAVRPAVNRGEKKKIMKAL